MRGALRARRAAAYRAYWEHMPFPKSARPVDADMRICGRLDWGTLARIHLLDDRQYRDVQVCPRPGRGGSNTLPLAKCPEMLDAKRTLLGATQEQWLADGWDTRRPWNLLAQQTLMARFSWRDPAQREVAEMPGGLYWTDGWDGTPAARARLLTTVAERKPANVVVLGGDVHTNYVADLKVDYDDLSHLERKLTRIISTMDNDESTASALAEAVGDSHLAGRIRDFGGSWEIHRAQIKEDIEWMHAKVEQISTEFTKVDTDLADGLKV